jgi:polyhydroxyalkanoate synthesis regulator phasin
MTENVDIIDRLDAVAESLVDEGLFIHASTVDESIDVIEELRQQVKNLEEKVQEFDNRYKM